MTNFVHIPDPAHALTIMRRFREKDDPVTRAAELFWLFYYGSMDFEALRQRLDEVKSLQGGYVGENLIEAMRKAYVAPASIIEKVSEELNAIERDCRIEYQPDRTLATPECYVSVHLTATKALALKSRDGLSEDVVFLEEQAVRFANLISGGMIEAFDPSQTKTPQAESDASSNAIAGMAYLNLFNLANKDGHYGEAINKLARGLKLITDTWTSFEPWNRPRWLSDWTVERYGNKPPKPMQELNPQDIADTFLNARDSGRDISWRQVTGDIETILECWDNLGRGGDETVVGDDGEQWDWDTFWQRCGGWVEAQLSPSEFHAILKKDRDQDAEDRLAKYFFAGVWESIPERGRRSLIDAELAWFTGKLGRHEAIFNHLRIATEEILYHMLWKPMTTWVDASKGKPQEGFTGIRASLAQSGKQPSLGEFEEMIRSASFPDFVASLGLSEKHMQFLKNRLQGHLKKLRLARRDAEHKLERTLNHDQVTPLCHLYIGIGKQGVPRTLLDIATSKSQNPLDDSS